MVPVKQALLRMRRHATGDLTLADRVFTCRKRAYSADRDLNAAAQPGQLGRAATPRRSQRQIPGPRSTRPGQPTPADGTALTNTSRVSVKPVRMKREQTFRPHLRLEPTTPEKGGAGPLIRVVRHALLWTHDVTAADVSRFLPDRLHPVGRSSDCGEPAQPRRGHRRSTALTPARPLTSDAAPETHPSISHTMDGR